MSKDFLHVFETDITAKLVYIVFIHTLITQHDTYTGCLAYIMNPRIKFSVVSFRHH